MTSSFKRVRKEYIHKKEKVVFRKGEKVSRKGGFAVVIALFALFALVGPMSASPELWPATAMSTENNDPAAVPGLPSVTPRENTGTETNTQPANTPTVVAQTADDTDPITGKPPGTARRFAQIVPLTENTDPAPR